LTRTDFAEALQARLRAHLEEDRHSRPKPKSDERRRIEALEAQIATLEDAVATTEALGEQQRQAAGASAKRVEALQAYIATLESAIATAQTRDGEQLQQEAETATRRVEALEAKIGALQNALANSEALGERRRQEAETAAKRVEVLEAHIAQVAISIKLAMMMSEGRITGLDLERLQGIADSVTGLKDAS
jgi:chromosome segregation ATPase